MADEAPFTMDVFNAAEVGHVWYVNDPPQLPRRHPEGHWSMKKTGQNELVVTPLRSPEMARVEWPYKARHICEGQYGTFMYLTAFEAVFDDDDLWE